jgi:hypothetical protein
MPRQKHANRDRTPSGQISRAKSSIARGENPAEWARIRDNLLAAARSPLLGTELGRLLFAKRITVSDFEAGRRYSETVARALRTIGLPGGEPAAEANVWGRRPFPAPGSEAWEQLTEAGQRAATTLDTLDAVLGPTKAAVDEVCIRGAVSGSWVEYLQLQDGLSRLHRFFSAGRRRG